MRKKLLFLASRVPWPPTSGDKLKNYHLLAELAKSYDLTLVVIGSEPLCDEAKGWLAQFGPLYYFQKSKVDFAWNLLRGLLHLPRPLQVSLYHFSDVQQTVDRLAAEHDAVFCSLVRTAAYARDLEIPRICDFSDSIGLHYRHSLEHLRNPFLRLVYGLEARLLLRYEARILEQFELSCFLNQEEMNHFARPDKTIWTPMGTNPLLLTRSDRDPASSRSVLFLGKMNYLPNVLAVEWFAREVMPLLPEDVHFKIVGTHPLPRVKALASDRIEVTGFIDDPYPILSGALAVVVPMLIGGGIQNKLLEAMALGCVTINSSHAVARALENKKKKKKKKKEGRKVRPGEHLWSPILPRNRLANPVHRPESRALSRHRNRSPSVYQGQFHMVALR